MEYSASVVFDTSSVSSKRMRRSKSSTPPAQRKPARGSMTCFSLSPSQLGPSKMRESDGIDQFGGEFARTHVQVLAHDALRLLLFAVVAFANRKTGQKREVLPAQGGHHARREIETLHELPGLKQRLVAPHQARRRFQRHPDRQRPPSPTCLSRLRNSICGSLRITILSSAAALW